MARHHLPQRPDGDAVSNTKRTTQLARNQWLSELIASHVQSALEGTWDGRGMTPYFAGCRRQNLFRGLTTIFSRDTGYHTSGWWKNPDYERCYHLSVSFFDPLSQEPTQPDADTVRKLVRGFFGVHRRLIWVEPPYSDHGKKLGVTHYRLFCDEAWQPIKPRGEVYSRELTEAGWLSYSDVQAKQTPNGERR